MPAVNARIATIDPNSKILNNIEFDKTSLEFNNILDNFETVTTNSTAFLTDVADGQVTLKIMGEKFYLNLQETHIVSDDATITTENGTVIPVPKAYSYKGSLAGKANSNVRLTVSDDVIIGEINIGSKSYFIEQTSMTYNGKVVHVVYCSDAFKGRKIFEYNSDAEDYTEEVQTDVQTTSLNQAQTSHNSSFVQILNVNNSSNEKTENKDNDIPDLGLLESLMCLYYGWKLRKEYM